MSENVTPFAAKKERDDVDAIFKLANDLHAGGAVVGVAFTIVTRTGETHNAYSSMTGHYHRVHSGVHRLACKIALADD